MTMVDGRRVKSYFLNRNSQLNVTHKTSKANGNIKRNGPHLNAPNFGAENSDKFPTLCHFKWNICIDPNFFHWRKGFKFQLMTTQENQKKKTQKKHPMSYQAANCQLDLQQMKIFPINILLKWKPKHSKCEGKYVFDLKLHCENGLGVYFLFLLTPLYEKRFVKSKHYIINTICTRCVLVSAIQK